MISAGRYLLGIVLLALVLAPLALAAIALRAKTFPGCRASLSRLVEVGVAVAGLLVISELLGTVGAFRIGWLIVASWTIGGLALMGMRRSEAAPTETHLPWEVESRGACAVVAGVCAGLAVAWLAAAHGSLHVGITAPDDLSYHMPFAARFAQSGFTTHLHYVEDDPLLAFYPASSELIHAVGIGALGNDGLSMLLNIGWGAYVLLAAWCLGSRWGSPAIAVCGGAIVLALPVIFSSQAGQAGNDVMGLAMFSGGLALLAWRDEGPAAPVLAAAFAGIAASVKLSMLVPACALLIAALALSGSARRRFACAGVAVITGGFWYARNWVIAGSPLAPEHLTLGPIHLPAPASALAQAFNAPLVRYFGVGGLWSNRIEPGLHQALGPAWWAVALLALAGIVLASTRGGSLRIAAVIGCASALAYPLIPNSGYLLPVTHLFFSANLRYLTPALFVGLVLLGCLPRTGGRRWLWGALTLEVVLIILSLRSGTSASFHLSGKQWVAIGLVGFAGAMIVLAGDRAGRIRRCLQIVGLGATAAVLIGGYFVDRSYVGSRYTKSVGYASFLQPLFSWARTVSHSRIALFGSARQYPLYGINSSNSVWVVGRPGPHAGFTPPLACVAWREALNGIHPRFVAITGLDSYSGRIDPAPLVAVSWIRGDPAQRPVLQTPGVFVFRVTGALDPGRCRS